MGAASIDSPPEPEPARPAAPALLTPRASTSRFPDPVLYTAVREALGKAKGEKLTLENLSGLTTLDGQLSGTSDLSGTED